MSESSIKIVRSKDVRMIPWKGRKDSISTAETDMGNNIGVDVR